ncbi:MAG TPA: UDP-N-acetylmuramoyl-L-alanyl-D-glutamate--2,6-diaminopimelate ligase [Vicinamibacteria bacterium]|jgi:UDP-N-acetylmuramoyl-L-alanyl-D-glutamate--2,6-diaminopimelate ligase
MLSALARRVPGARATGPEAEVAAVTHDSRRVSPGALFVAVRGAAADGNDYVDGAWSRGAAAVASEREAPSPARAWLQVPDAREALALASAAVLGDPATQLGLVGVTGTNGKTTTTYLIDAALRAAGRRVGLLGTVQYRIGDRLAEAVRTTPESSDLQALFREMVDDGCAYAVLEVSSHSLALKRVFGCTFRVAVFTNLTRDHLDFHGDMDAYFEAKRILFEQNLARDGHAVINLDDDRGAELVRASRGHVWTYSLDAAKGAQITAHDLRLSLAGTSFRAVTPVGTLEVRSPLLGRFNVENLLAALGAAFALGVPPETAVAGVCSVTGVPGRLERVDAGQPFTVVVDYAHTDDALRNLLETVRTLGPRRVITVFGCGGDRDRSKRPLMGAVAARMSDVVIVTSDNPRSEPPEAILEEIQRGMNGGRGAERHAITDRREAIARAMEMAGEGDAVVIAGKGHETYQVLRDRTVPFDDRQVARQALSRTGTRRKA